MASLKVQVQSKKLIKPSNPTSYHLQNLKLSLFDQFAPPVYIDIIFYYLSCGDDCSPKRIAQLEKSLSKTLTHFYPLAGRFIQNDFSIDCCDQGIEYFQAQVNEKLAEFLQGGPQLDLLDKFLPWDVPPPANPVSSPLLAIQINNFDCGGLVIGIRLSHIIADATSMTMFINEWAANSSQNGINQMLSPSSVAPLFPARISLPRPNSLGPANDDKVVTRRFLFEQNAISHFKSKDVASMNCKPTRVAVAIAVIWKALIGVALAKHGHLRDSLLFFAVNLRDKVALQVSEVSHGNFWMPIAVPFVAKNDKMELNDLMILLQDRIRDVKAKLAKASCEDISSMLMNCWREHFEGSHQVDGADVYNCSSWCRLPIYEADFGWGKPFWVSSGTHYFEVIALMDASEGTGGIEAWISLKEKDMILFKQDPRISALHSS